MRSGLCFLRTRLGHYNTYAAEEKRSAASSRRLGTCPRRRTTLLGIPEGAGSWQLRGYAAHPALGLDCWLCRVLGTSDLQRRWARYGGGVCGSSTATATV